MDQGIQDLAFRAHEARPDLVCQVYFATALFMDLVSDRSLLAVRLNCGFYEAFKQRMRAVRPGFQFRVRLGCDKPGVSGQLNHLYNASVRRNATEVHACFC